MARVCVAEVAGATVETPVIIHHSEDGAFSIRVEGILRTLHWGDRLFKQSTKVTPPLSAGRKGKANHLGDGVYSVRLPADEDAMPADASMLIVENGFELRRDPGALATMLTRVRKDVGQRTLLFVNGMAEPANLAMLAYMGVDIHDDSFARAMASRGILLRPEGRFRSDATFEELVNANLSAMAEELDLVKTFIRKDRLRELVDQRAASSPANVVALRLFDKHCWDIVEEQVPVVGGRFSCNTPQSLHRPDVVRHRRRIGERYQKPAHKKVLVLLPCSARKPYFTSRSHRRFIEAIRSADHFSLVHELILTSPLGLVPRELETFYPAAHYDIPVSGEWTLEEVSMINGMLRSYLVDNSYDHVVSHLGDGGLLTSGIDAIDTSMGEPGSDPALRLLDETLRSLCRGYAKVPAMEDRIRTMGAMLSYQFGEGAEKLLDGVTVVGKYPYWKLMDGKVQLGMHTLDRGMTSLTMDGAARLADAGINIVSIEDFEVRGSIFAIGVKNADHRIRSGDEVAVEQGGRIAAVGVAQMSGPQMVALSRGVAVKVRHKAK